MSELKVGFGRADITPQESVPLGGYGNSSHRMSDNVLNPLAATCIAFTDAAGTTALVFTLDLTSATEYFANRFQPAVSKATGVPMDHIFASGTHNHSSPDLGNTEQPSIPRYLDLLERQLVAAAKDAMADRKSAKMFITSTATKGMNFVRRYILQDGTPAGDNYGHFDQSPIARHETEVDNTMQFVKFVREGAPDVILVNFQTHPHRTGGGGQRKDVSSDIVGVMRREFEASTGCLMAYFTGASGNVNPRSRIPEENPYNDHEDHGKAMAELAVSILGSFVPVETGDVKVVWNTLEREVNHTLDYRVPEARYIRDNFKATGDRPTWTIEAKKLGFNSVYHAGAVIRHSEGPKTMDIPLGSLSIGDVAFAVAPYEMFDTNGMEIKKASPFKMTFILTCATGKSRSYIPSALGFKNGGYSTDNCWFMPGTGEVCAQALVDELKTLHG